MENQIQVNEKDTALAAGHSLMSSIIAEGGSFIPGLRLASKFYKEIKSADGEVEQPRVEPGEWFSMSRNFGKDIKVLIGPWRYAARLFEGETLLASSLNGFPGNQYVPEKNDWIIKGISPVFRAIKEKHTPDDQAKARKNRVGFDVLLYLPDHNYWTTYFISGAAKGQQSDVFPTMVASLNRLAVLGSKDGKGSFDYQVPTIRVMANESMNWPTDAPEQFNLFLNIPEETVASDKPDSRER